MSSAVLARVTACAALLALAAGAGQPLLNLVLDANRPTCCAGGRCCCEARRDDGSACVRRACGCDRPQTPALAQPLRQDAVLAHAAVPGRALPASSAFLVLEARALSRSQPPPVPPPKAPRSRLLPA